MPGKSAKPFLRLSFRPKSAILFRPCPISTGSRDINFIKPGLHSNHETEYYVYV
jgi:hypothetical protein